MTPVMKGVVARVRSMLGWRTAERRMHDEFAFHLDMETERNLARGMTPEAARRAAVVAFGGAEGHRESMRDGRGARWAHEFAQDTRLALRLVRRETSFSLAVIATLALGIGATSAVFTLFRRAVLEPLPFPRAGELVQVSTRYAGWGVQYGSVSPPEVGDITAATGTFSAVASYRPGPADLALGTGGAERVRAMRVSAEFLGVLGVAPATGRPFAAADDRPGAPDVAILTAPLARRLGDAGSPGATIRVNGAPHQVIGVLPASFAFDDAEVLVPLRPGGLAAIGRSGHFLRVIARRAVPAGRMAADLATLSARLRTDHPQNYLPDMQWSLVARSLRDATLGEARDVLGFLLLAVGLVLAIACANVANLLLARMDRREREMALRAALGAGRGRLVRQLVTEGLVFAVIGGTAGTVIAATGVNALLALAPNAIPGAATLAVDGGMLLTAFGVACASAVAFGVVPALRGTSGTGDASAQLARARGANAGGRRASRFMSAIVASEFALATVVLVCAGLLVRTYADLARVNPGFDPAGVAAFDITLPEPAYADSIRSTTYFRSLRHRLMQAPGVVSAGGVLSLPLRSGTGNIDIDVEGYQVPAGQSAPSPLIQVVTPGYFETMRIPIVRGRAPAETDDERGPLVAWVNQRAAARLWPGVDPLGRRFKFGGDTSNTWFTVVGVVGDVRTAGTAHEPQWEYYLSHPQVAHNVGASDFYRALSFVVRTGGDPAALAPVIRREVAALDPAVAPAMIATMQSVVSQSVSRQRLAAMLFTAFALLAAALAAVGIAGVLSYGVARRQKEIGIRVALGASRMGVARAVTGGGLGAALAGLAGGVAAAIGASRVLESQLFGVSPTSVPVYMASVGGLVAVAALATVIPLRRMSRIDPTEALRAD